jgi:hypothetical protein
MAEEQGTRETKSFFLSHPSSRQDNSGLDSDKGMSKRLVLADATFSGNTLSGTGTFTVFKVYDWILIVGTQGGLNNGARTVLSVAAGSITCDFPFKTEGPTAGVEVRTQ